MSRRPLKLKWKPDDDWMNGSCMLETALTVRLEAVRSGKASPVWNDLLQGDAAAFAHA